LLAQCIVFVSAIVIVVPSRVKNPHARSSSLFTVLVLAFVTACNLQAVLLPDAYAGFLFCFSVAWDIYIFSRSATRHAMIKRGKTGTGILKQASDADDLGSKSEGLRKMFHLSGFLIVLCYFVVTPAIAPALSFVHAFPTVWDAAAGLTAFVLSCGVIAVTAIDIQRILFGEAYGMRHLSGIIREKEIGAPAAQTYLLSGAAASWFIAMICSWFIGPVAMIVSIVAIVMSTFADGMAAIIGKAKGKHKVKRPWNQTKSVEGFVAGFVTALLVSLPFLLSFDGGWLLAIAGSAVLLAIDYASLPIADNVLNPVAITIAMEIVVFLL